jgi:hypothetical protein
MGLTIDLKSDISTPSLCEDKGWSVSVGPLPRGTLLLAMPSLMLSEEWDPHESMAAGLTFCFLTQ